MSPILERLTNVMNAPGSTALGAAGALSLYLPLVGARAPETLGDFVVFVVSVACFLLGALRGPSQSA